MTTMFIVPTLTPFMALMALAMISVPTITVARLDIHHLRLLVKIRTRLVINRSRLNIDWRWLVIHRGGLGINRVGVSDAYLHARHPNTQRKRDVVPCLGGTGESDGCKCQRCRSTSHKARAVCSKQ